MNHIVRSAAAFRDAQEIWRYIARDDMGAADRQLQRIDERLTFLAGAPLAGSPRPDLDGTLRSVAVGNYLILYRPIADGIRVVRILNAARDVRRVLRR